MAKNLYIDASHPNETRVVLKKDDHIEDYEYESVNNTLIKNNIYLGKVSRIEPSLQAAFVEYGSGRNGFLAFSEIHPDYYQIPVADKQALLEAQAAEAEKQEAAEVARLEADENLNTINSSNSTSISLKEIINNWDSILSKVSESGTSIGTFLSHGKPIEVVGTKIVIGFPESNKFQIDVLKKNSRKIEKSIGNVIKKELRVDLIINQNKLSTNSEPTDKNLVTKKILEVFGGDLKS